MQERPSDKPNHGGDFSVYEVFTPTSSATLTAVYRHKLHARIGAALSVPGRQLFIYGRSGAGKSTALFAALANRQPSSHVVVRCTNATTVSSLLKATLTRYGIPDIYDEAVSLHLAAQELGQRGAPIVIEDAHRLAPAERVALLNFMKVISDLGSTYPELKVVVLAAVESPRDFADFETEFSSRIAEIAVTAMPSEDLEKIVKAGGGLLNVDTKEIEAPIVTRSGGSAAITHHLALAAFEHAGARTFVRSGTRISVEVLAEVIAEEIASTPETLLTRIREALAIREREAAQSILQALSTFSPAGVSTEELIQALRPVFVDPSMPFLPEVINELSTRKRGAVIERLPGGIVRFTQPRFHSYWAMVSQPLR